MARRKQEGFAGVVIPRSGRRAKVPRELPGISDFPAPRTMVGCARDGQFKADQRENMKPRRMKVAITLLLAFVVAWQAFFTAVAAGGNAPAAGLGCCCTGCDFKHCSTPACCARPADDRTASAPASAPSRPSNEWQALIPSVIALLALPIHPVDEPLAVPSLLRWSAAVPIFQRDCSYLI